MDIIDQLRENIRGKGVKIVFPEGTDKRIQAGAIRLKSEGEIEPILLGNAQQIADVAKANNLDLTGISIVDPMLYSGSEELIREFMAVRKGKATREVAARLMKDTTYFGTMMVYLGHYDGMVSGAVNSTGDTVRPALQIIKTKPGHSRISGSMLMLGPNGERYIFSDVAINMKPDAQELAEIAVVSAATAREFGMDPKVAMLSFSTKGSAENEDTVKVVRATELARGIAPDLNLDGELQFDAAIAPEVGTLKAPGSPVAGYANVFIFPDLQAANIGYKVGQRLGGYEAIGPILQGLNKPISDLSRGCNVEEVYKLTLVTANQAVQALTQK